MTRPPLWVWNEFYTADDLGVTLLGYAIFVRDKFIWMESSDGRFRAFNETSIADLLAYSDERYGRRVSFTYKRFTSEGAGTYHATSRGSGWR